jgi:hypothetical protein
MLAGFEGLPNPNKQPIVVDNPQARKKDDK